MSGRVYIEFWRGLICKPKIKIIVCQQSQIHKIRLILSSSALPWFHTGRVRISVVWLIPLHHLHCPSMFPIAWRNFHHKPALVASFILWLEYLLCAHHTHFPIFQLLRTHVDPLFCQPGPFTPCAPPCAPFCAPLHTSAHLPAPLHTFVL